MGKRKLNENDAPVAAPAPAEKIEIEEDIEMNEVDVPTPTDAQIAAAEEIANTAVAAAEKALEKEEKDGSFTGLGLDARLLQAIAKQNYSAPTLVQRKAIPLAIAGKDVLARAKTGSGKTAAYLLPVVHGILQRKMVRTFNPTIPTTSENEANDVSRSITSQQPPP